MRHNPQHLPALRLQAPSAPCGGPALSEPAAARRQIDGGHLRRGDTTRSLPHTVPRAIPPSQITRQARRDRLAGMRLVIGISR